MTIDEFKPSATKRSGEDAAGKVFARVRVTRNPARKEPWLKRI